MSDLENAGPPATVQARQQRTWDFMETLLVALIADGVFTLTSGLGVGVLLVLQGGIEGMSEAQLQALLMQGNWHGAAVILATPPTIAVLWIAIRMARREFGEYLALNWPSGGEVARGLAIITIILAVEGVVTSKVAAGGYQSDPILVVGGNRWIADLAHWGLHCWADPGRICRPWLHISGLVTVIPRTCRSYRAHIGLVGNEPHPI